jgi:hypothetical protein
VFELITTERAQIRHLVKVASNDVHSDTLEAVQNGAALVAVVPLLAGFFHHQVVIQVFGWDVHYG